MKLIHKIRRSYFTKGLAMLVALNMLFEIIWPTAAMALTSGPSQPEVQSFEPVETTDMVNMFTGDFTYNLPVIHLPGPNGGYPINLAYHGGIGMDQEASWVGLGWNINAGALVRNVRGFADDYNGDTLITKVDMKDNVTVGLRYGIGTEIVGGDPQLSYNTSVRYNNYKGFALSAGIGVPLGGAPNFQMGLSLDSETGLGLSVSMTIDGEFDDRTKNTYGLSYSNEGMGVSFSRSHSLKYGEYTEKKVVGVASKMMRYESKTHNLNDKVSAGSSGLGFSASTHAPVISMSSYTDNLDVTIKWGTGVAPVFLNHSGSGFFNIQAMDPFIKGKDLGKKVYGFENYQSASKYDLLDFSREKDGTITPMTPNLPTAQLTYDIYNVLGQGINGSFRPFRTDVGRVHDPYIKNPIGGISVAFDIGTSHVGLGGTVTMGSSIQQPWDYKNNWSTAFYFKDNMEQGTSYKYKDQERVYYRMHGDKSTFDLAELDFIGGTDAVQSEVHSEIMDKVDRLLVPSAIKSDRFIETVGSDGLEKRVPRNTLIHKFRNEELSNLYDNERISNPGDLAGHHDITETSIFYYDWSARQEWLPASGTSPSDPDQFLDRQTRGENNNAIGHHNGAYKVLNQDGQYYVYGLPAYNVKEVETMFSADASKKSEATAQTSAYVDFEVELDEVKYKNSGTDKYLNKKTKPPYAHSYLLTSILGADYVDIDDNGPTDDDLGYWVKMDYVKYADDYKWRAPFNGAQYSAGALTTEADDKGSYVYGEKELWYVSRMETKTHVLVFELEERRDNMEAAKELSTFTDGMGTRGGLYLEKISLYLKEDYYNNGAEDAIPLKEVHFQYDYSLCGNVKNNDEGTDLPTSIIDNADKGKLTLKKLWFTYEGSTKGAMRPYTFNYYNEPVLGETPVTYHEFKYDRWGNYKPDGNTFDHKYLPYVSQLESQTQSDANASTWSLKTIHLPSGGQIEMTYEADDYAYVQNEVATQMMKITKVNELTDNNTLYDYDVGNTNDFDDPRARRVYFELETPIPLSGYSDAQYAEEIYRAYIDKLVIDGKGDRNLYFKNYTQLRADEEGSYDYVSGYVPIENYDEDDIWVLNHDGSTYYKYGIDPGSSSPDGYTRGFLTIKRHVRKSDYNETTGKVEHTYSKKYHPFALAGWQHMKLNDPLMLTTPAGINLDDNTESGKGVKAEIVSSLLGFIPQTIQMFTGLWKYCYKKRFARRIKIGGESVIRLTTPDRRKIGGGQRVKQIKMVDNWNTFSGETNVETGIEYTYTKTDEKTGKLISSGVAQYEPTHGGDEIALRYPKYYVDNPPFKAKNHAYFEYPANESYFPSPTVGYSNVEVKSMNTRIQMEAAADGGDPGGISTKGITAYEFYTAKDFPVIVEETDIIKAKFNVPIPIPFIGRFERKKIKATQGYKIELNDMHGRMKSIKTFGLNADYTQSDFLTSSTEYIYNANTEYTMSYNKYYKKQVSRLINEVETLDHDHISETPSTTTRKVGIEYDFFTDQRQSKSSTTTAGAHGNVDVTLVGIPLPGVWPAFSSVKRDMKTFTTNKIIFKSGLVSEVHRYDGRARVVTKNEVYDAQTGRPIITSINNEFEDQIYNYSHPAHWEYDQMGGAYKNINLEFEAKIVDKYSGSGLTMQFIMESDDVVIDQLVSGDELMGSYYRIDGKFDRHFTATYLKEKDNNEGIVYIDNLKLPANDHGEFLLGHQDSLCVFKVIRSGRRNHVFTDAGQIVSKDLMVNSNGYSTARYADDISVTEDIAGDPVTHTVKRTYFNNILSSTAVVFRNEWENLTAGKNANPYETGEAGIWRPYKSYTFVGDRNYGASDAVPTIPTDIRHNGEMDKVYQFNWQIPFFEKYAPQWQWISEITKYSKHAYELENTDRLDIKSSALYGYKGSVVVGIGSNAGHHEIGTEDFERHPALGTISDSNEEDASDHLVFYNDAGAGLPETKFSRNYRILSGKALSAGKFKLELETEDAIAVGDKIQLTLQTSNYAIGGKSDNYIFHSEVTSVVYTIDGHALVEVQTEHHFNLAGTYLSLLGSGTHVSGRAALTKSTEVDLPENPAPDNSTSNVAFVNGKAHTGDQSMRFSHPVFYPQVQLDLIKGKTYVFSAWVSKDDTRKISYSDVNLSVHQHAGGITWNYIVDSPTIKRGKVIEGWQKIEFEFTPTVHDAIIGIQMSGSGYTYVDDIRISPKTGGIITHVYDPVNFRLKATLNANNYATFYFYDEEGNLHLTKQETERGIQTLTENRGHIKTGI